jgi:hypothetical protein
MAPSIIKFGVAVVAQLIGYVLRRYVGDVVERQYKHEITYLDPDGADREYSKWSWEFWR